MARLTIAQLPQNLPVRATFAPGDRLDQLLVFAVIVILAQIGRGTGGIEYVKIRAEAFDAYGHLAPEGLPIDFNITAGPGGGEALNGDPIGPVTLLTNSLGKVYVTLNAGTISGTVRVRARAGAVVSTATQVTIRSGPAAFISLGADDCNTPSWEVVNFNNGKGGVVSVLTGTRITANFGEDDQVTGNTGCNDYFGPYRTEGNIISIGALGATQKEAHGLLIRQLSQMGRRAGLCDLAFVRRRHALQNIYPLPAHIQLLP